MSQSIDSSPAPSEPHAHRRVGVALVSVTEFWERFSYYSLAGLLPLFLTAGAETQGFGWSKEDAVQLFGIYSGMIFAAPAIGGWAASVWTGEQRAIIWGGGLIVVGQGLLAWILGHPGVEFRLVLLFVGLLFTILGTGLLKPAVSAVVGMLFDQDDPQRGPAYSLFMTGVWAGAFLANLVAGTVGELYGWDMGCLTAALGMAVGMAGFLALRRRALAGVGAKPAPKPSQEAAKAVGPLDRRRLGALAAGSVFTVIYAVAFYQKMGFLSLMVRDSVDRTIGGFTVPITWFLSIGTGAFVLLAAPITTWLAKAEKRGMAIDAVRLQVVGLLCLVVGYAILTGGVLFSGTGPIPMAWFVVGYVFFGIGDIFIWPPQIALASRLAPLHLASLVIGVWYVCVGLGSYFAGVVGALGYLVSKPVAFLSVIVMLLVAAAALTALRPALLRAMSDAPRA